MRRIPLLRSAFLLAVALPLPEHQFLLAGPISREVLQPQLSETPG